MITHYSENADRVVNLSQTSIVRINASPETVNFYERQGNDLIVHMKDGTTVRYQNFFHLDAEGQHSELIFEDDKGVHHALFPFASEAGPAVAEAITPTMADTTLGALTGAEGLTTLQALGGIAAIGGIAGVAIAASNSAGVAAAATMITTTAAAITAVATMVAVITAAATTAVVITAAVTTAAEKPRTRQKSRSIRLPMTTS
ncbi:BapA prefix-like domain-containing protein [Cronobacter sakazakii]|nr:BapA prefix-like domain-containing protein [Cronobacter sakazakii]